MQNNINFKRYFLEIAYNGKNFHGWQQQHENSSTLTVQQVLTTALQHQLKRPNLTIIGCGRTDTGVHASQYFVHFEYDEHKTLPENLVFRLNRMLNNDILVKRLIDHLPHNAHARYDATYRAYDYYIHFEKNPFLGDFSYHYPFLPLDFEAMSQAAQLLPLYNDFPMFCKTGGNSKTTLCNIFKAELFFNPNEKKLRFHIAANRFLRGMVRLIVGTLLCVGKHKISLDEFKHTLDRQHKRFEAMNISAPPQGLFLSEVRYPYL